MKKNDWQSQHNSTQRISTMKRNLRTNYMGQPSEQLINQMARIRLVEDELLSQKIKNQTLERKTFEYIDTITQLEYTIGDLRLMLQNAQLELAKHEELGKQINLYSTNLRQVGLELSSLNEILEKKNKQCQKLTQMNSKLKEQNSQLQQKLKTQQNKKQLQKRKLRQILQLFGSQIEPSFSQQVMRDIQLIEQGVNQLKQNLNKTKSALEKQRKQSSQSLIKQKQKIISLEYSLKLAEKRNQDLQKKKVLQSSFCVDKKIEDMIQQMLKKQEELSMRINQLDLQKQALREELEIEKSANSHLIELRKKDYEKQIKQAKQTIKNLIHEKTEISQRLEELSSVRQIESSRMVSEQLQLSRKYRQFCQQNKRLKLKVNQLQSDKKMLEKQLSLRNPN